VCYYEGEGHSGSITKVKISPDQKTIISVGNEGAILFWTTPELVVKDVVEPELPTLTKNEKK
jgi:WD40 repeat protein